MFEKSQIYKEAKEKYIKEIYQEILNPINVFMGEGDVLWLFYNQDRTKDIYNQIVKIYEDNYEDDMYEQPFHLGCEKPSLCKYTFMGNTYDCISIRYDGQIHICESEFKQLRRNSSQK